MSVSEILNNIKNLETKKIDELFNAIFTLRLQRRGVNVLSDLEVSLLEKINIEFDSQKLERLKYLDWKSELGSLSPEEEEESLKLAEALEGYGVERLNALSQLATLRQISIDQLMEELDLNIL